MDYPKDLEKQFSEVELDLIFNYFPKKKYKNKFLQDCSPSEVIIINITSNNSIRITIKSGECKEGRYLFIENLFIENLNSGDLKIKVIRNINELDKELKQIKNAKK